MRLHKVYIEFVFLDNFIIDFMILLFAALLTKSKLRWTRLVLSASAGSIYACAVFTATGFAVSVITKIAVGLAMCLTAYYDRYDRNLWKNTCAFFITTFVFAGSVYAMSYFFGQPSEPGLPIILRPVARDVLLGLGAGAALLGYFGRIRRKVIQRERYSVDLTLDYKGKHISVKAFTDTGNMLTEPLSGLDVVLVTKNTAKALFGKEDIDLFDHHNEIAADRLRAVPYSTVGGNGVMFGIEIDGIEIRGRNEKVRAVVCAAKDRLAQGCEALIGGALTDKLLGGSGNDKAGYKQDNCVDTYSPEGGLGLELYQRDRRAASAADPGGGNGASGSSGEG